VTDKQTTPGNEDDVKIIEGEGKILD